MRLLFFLYEDDHDHRKENKENKENYDDDDNSNNDSNSNNHTYLDPTLSYQCDQLLFDIFDVDRRGKVTMAELDAMLRMLYGSPEADPDLLRFFAINGDGDEDSLAFDEFAQVGRSSRVSNRATAGVSI